MRSGAQSPLPSALRLNSSFPAMRGIHPFQFPLGFCAELRYLPPFSACVRKMKINAQLAAQSPSIGPPAHCLWENPILSKWWQAFTKVLASRCQHWYLAQHFVNCTPGKSAFRYLTFLSSAFMRDIASKMSQNIDMYVNIIALISGVTNFLILQRAKVEWPKA